MADQDRRGYTRVIPMSSRAIHRLTTTLLVVVSLLFSQLALAAYICSTDQQAPAAMAAMEMHGEEPCEGMDAAQPALCFQHCSEAPQTFDPLKVPAVSLPAVVQMLVVPLVIDVDGARETAAVTHAPNHPPPDPLFLSTLRLRV